ALILLGSVWALLATLINRLSLHFIRYRHFDTVSSGRSNVLIVGDEEECLRVKSILQNYPNRFNLLGFVRPEEKTQGNNWLGSMENLPLLTEIYKANEIIFCSKNVDGTRIMQYMGSEFSGDIRYKIIPESGAFIIGSNSKNTTGEFYSINISYALSKKEIRKKKRTADILICLGMLPILPLMFLKPGFLKSVMENWMSCFLGKKTWVGYSSRSE